MSDPTAAVSAGGPTTDAVVGGSGAVPAGGPSGKPRSLAGDAWRDLRRNPVFLVACFFLLLVLSMAVVPRLWTSVDPTLCELKFAQQTSSPGHPFGYDAQGCDLYSQVIYGARPSIIIGILVTVVAGFVAVVVGSISGFYGGWVDGLLQRITDIFLGFPFLLAAILFLSRIEARNVVTVSAALVAFGWATQTRVMRGAVMGVKNMDYVAAARALGASDGRLMFRHIMPNAVMSVLVLMTLTVGAIIGAEAALTFLGVGLQFPEISWGIQLNAAQRYFFDSPHLLMYPALFLIVTVLSFILIGDAIRDAFDPKLR